MNLKLLVMVLLATASGHSTSVAAQGTVTGAKAIPACPSTLRVLYYPDTYTCQVTSENSQIETWGYGGGEGGYPGRQAYPNGSGGAWNAGYGGRGGSGTEESDHRFVPIVKGDILKFEVGAGGQSSTPGGNSTIYINDKVVMVFKGAGNGGEKFRGGLGGSIPSKPDTENCCVGLAARGENNPTLNSSGGEAGRTKNRGKGCGGAGGGGGAGALGGAAGKGGNGAENRCTNPQQQVENGLKGEDAAPHSGAGGGGGSGGSACYNNQKCGALGPGGKGGSGRISFRLLSITRPASR